MAKNQNPVKNNPAKPSFSLADVTKAVTNVKQKADELLEDNRVFRYSALAAAVLLLFFGLFTYFISADNPLVSHVDDKFSYGAAHVFRAGLLGLLLFCLEKRKIGMCKAVMSALLAVSLVNDVSYAFILGSQPYGASGFMNVLEFVYILAVAALFVTYFLCCYKPCPVMLKNLPYDLALLALLNIIFIFVEGANGAWMITVEKIGEWICYLFVTSICVKTEMFNLAVAGEVASH